MQENKRWGLGQKKIDRERERETLRDKAENTRLLNLEKRNDNKTKRCTLLPITREHSVG